MASNPIAIIVVLLVLIGGSPIGPLHPAPGYKESRSLGTETLELSLASASLAEGKGPAGGIPLTCSAVGTFSMGCIDQTTRGSPRASDSGWSLICAKGHCPPPVRGGAGMAFDPITGYVVLFGGINNLTLSPNTTYDDTWVFANGNWTQLHISGPSARLGEYMAYDPADHYILLFGGGPYLTLNGSLYYDDTWEFQNGTWTKLDLSFHPSARGLGGIAWDPIDGYLLMYGGMSSQTDIHSDTWTFAHGQWKNLSLSEHPPPLLAPSLAFDPSSANVLLFGGATPSPGVQFGLDLDQTWSYAHGIWTNLTGKIRGSIPDGRMLGAMAYDPAQGFMVLFGGWNTTADLIFGDTWIYIDGYWSELYLSPTPASSIIGASLISTTPTSGLVLFGGLVGNLSAYSATNATWVFGPPPANTTITSQPPPTPYGVYFSVAPRNCNSISFNGTHLSSGSREDLTPGNFYVVSATPCPGYEFKGWYFSGGVSVGSPENATSELNVVGSGTVTAYYVQPSGTSYQWRGASFAESLAGIAIALAIFVVGVTRVNRRKAAPLL